MSEVITAINTFGTLVNTAVLLIVVVLFGAAAFFQIIELFKK